MYKLSTSMMCADPFKLESQIEIINLHTDYFHVDIMDGHFVPNLALSIDYVKTLKLVAKRPIDIHLMVDNPYDYLDDLIKVGVHCISVHVETINQSIFRVLTKIKENGIKTGIAISPRFSVEDYLLLYPLVNKVIVMTVEPGFAGQKMIEETIPKISKLRSLKDKNNYNFDIEVDGSNNYSTFLRYKNAGAEISILGTGLFNSDNLENEYVKIREFIAERNENIKYTLGIDVGGTHIRYGLIDTNYQIKEVYKIKTIKSSSLFSNWIKNLINQDYKDIKIDAISIGLPGIVNPHTLNILSLPNLKALENDDFLQKLEKELKIKITVQKDTVYLLAHDINKFKLKGKNVLGFYLGTGFGSSIYLDSKFYLGDTFSSGEVGHLEIFNVDNQCGCGNFGCTETAVSGWYLESIRLKHFPDTSIEDIFVKHVEHDKIIKFIENFAQSLSIVINLFDVSSIVLGGGVINMENFPLDMLIEFLLPKLRSDEIRGKMNFFLSESNPDDGIVGSAIFAKEHKI